MSPVIQSFKKVLVEADASFTAGFRQEILVTGVDSIAAGQTTINDPQVPTGSIIKYIECHFGANNPTAIPAYIMVTLQYVLGGQSLIDPNVVGGNPQRNQVLHMKLFNLGVDQTSNHVFKFKIPPKFQRVREGMSWLLVWNNTATVNRKVLSVYKFYR